MRILLFLVLSAACWADTRSLVLSGDTLSATAPSASPYTGAGTERIEFRIHDCTDTPGTENAVLNFHGVRIHFPDYNSTSLRMVSTIDGNGSESAFSYTMLGTWNDDVLVRVQRYMGNGTTGGELRTEVWETNGTRYNRSNIGYGTGSYTNSRAGTVTVGGATSNCSIAWVRWYSTLETQAETNKPAEVDATADLGNWSFNDALTDSSGNSLTYSVTGGVSAYGDTPIYAPVCSAGADTTWYTGSSGALDGSASRPLDGGSTLTYSWSRLSGPNTPTLSSSTVASPTVTGHTETLSGKASYVYRLTCTDSTMQTAQDDVEVGAVTLDGYGNISTGDSTLDDILGPIPNETGWGFFDEAELDIVNALGAAISDTANQPDYSTQRSSGTCTLDDIDSITCTGGITGVGGGDYVVVTWTTVDGAGTGRMYGPVQTVDDADTITIGSGASYGMADVQCSNTYPCTIGQVYARKTPSGNFGFGQWSGYDNNAFGTNSWNYYGGPLAYARAWVRTGRSTYLEYFRTAALLHWQWGIDHFGAKGEPRVRDLASTILYMHDQSITSWWAPMEAFIEDGVTRWGIVDAPVTGDKRESGYVLEHTALAARHDPDSGRHATYCTSVEDQVTEFNSALISIDGTHGYWPEDLAFNTNFYPTKPPGNSPWRTDLAVKGMMRAYDVLIDTTAAGCDNATLAADALASIQKVLNWWTDYGTYTYTGMDYEANHRAVYYEIHFETRSRRTSGAEVSYGTGTIACTNGSTACTGTGTSFTTEISSTFCNGTKWMLLVGPTGTAGSGQVVKVASCADATHLTLTSNWTGATFSGSTFVPADPADTDCGDSLADFCSQAGSLPYDLTRLMPQPFGWMAAKTYDTAWLSTGEELFSTAAGGPADGYGGVDSCSAPAGVTCSNEVTDWTVVLSSGVGSFGKNAWQFLGAPGGSSFVGYRNIALASPTVASPTSTMSGKVSFGGKISFR